MDPGFCPDCGTILPLLRASSNKVACFNCCREVDPSAFGTMESEYTIHFNSYENKKSDQATRTEQEDADGPIVNRQCPKCNNDEMSYATLQLRSADEGQTVFFTCTKCKYKMSENS